ncbi:hypothetical protein OW763_05755 [Clostridium aestuarii]|uniref:Uncharacterized protein n=1 Tax=Clostridium aestuarii TaxID=338193 RepID=A0ABT4CXX8_9CLOT|nr:hypothetical protein [Clostridium aestuarii]MCY6483853.1 hypothetical protein [Clostridium aestuarii]
MIISLRKNNDHFNKYLATQMQTMTPDNEFPFLLNLFDKSIKERVSVDLHFDTNYGLEVIKGKIKDVELNIGSGINDVNIKIIFLKKDNSLICFDCDHVGSSTVRYNEHSVPGKFNKYYIYNKYCSVKIGFIFHNI